MTLPPKTTTIPTFIIETPWAVLLYRRQALTARATTATPCPSSRQLRISSPSNSMRKLYRSRALRWQKSRRKFHSQMRKRLPRKMAPGRSTNGQRIATPRSSLPWVKKVACCSRSTREWRTFRRRRTMEVDWATSRGWLRSFST